LLEAGEPQAALAVLNQAEERGIAGDFTLSIRATALAASGEAVAASQLRQEQIDAGSRNPAFYADEAKFLLETGQPLEALAVLDQADERGIANEVTKSIRESVQRALQRGAAQPPVTASVVLAEQEAAKRRITELLDRGDLDGAADALDDAGSRGLADHELATLMARLIAARKQP
jgi:hypothetical protein